VIPLHLESSPSEVGMWLRSQPLLVEYANNFEENAIDGQALHELTHPIAKELGVEKIGHWTQIRRKGRSLIKTNKRIGMNFHPPKTVFIPNERVIVPWTDGNYYNGTIHIKQQLDI